MRVRKEIAQMVRAALNNHWSEARELERRFSPLFEANFWESNPGPVKTILKLMGRCDDTCAFRSSRPRRPPGRVLNSLAGEMGLLKHAPIPLATVQRFSSNRRKNRRGA